MPKIKVRKTQEEKLIQARLHKRKKYEEIKNDPEKYKIQKEKERQRYLKRKEQNKIKGIADMTPREQRMQRKKWKVNSRRHLEKKKKDTRIQEIIIDASISTSDREENVATNQDPLEGPSYQNQDEPKSSCKSCQFKKKYINRLRYNSRKQIGKLQMEKERIEKEKNILKIMLAKARMSIKRLREEVIKTSTEQKVDTLITTVNEDKREEVKKKLLFGEIISKNLAAEFQASTKKEKRRFSNIVMKSKDRLKQFKILGQASKFTVRDNVHTQSSISHTKTNIKQQIEEFFEDDSNTKISPDKKEFITRFGVRKQKRYFTDTLTNLHKKFVISVNSKVSYSSFCKNRPFWAVYPKESDRNTCACKTHVNFDLLVKSLNKNRIIIEANGTALLQSLCCNVNDENCLNRSCEACKNRIIHFNEFSNECKINYYEWCAKKENYYTKGQEKTKIVNTKSLIKDYPRNIVNKLEKSLSSYFKHCANIVAQYKHIKSLKMTLTTNEAIIHLDFSENYSGQFNEEIQSYHFGGSRQQITLHTSVVYLIEPETGINKTYSVCSISKCNRHDASAIWAHIIPLLGYVKEISPNIDTIHLISDSPSSQYRNRFIFYAISQLQQDFPDLNFITWNYLEAGHGKGAPDGVGAVLKRTADQIIRFGNDISTVEEFWKHVQVKVKNIKLLSVSEKDIQDRTFPSVVPAFRGTMSVHQVLWSYNSPRMTFRKLSCFLCENGEICSHGYHLGYMDLPPLPDNNDVQLQDFLDKNNTLTRDVLQDVTNCLYPTTEYRTQQSQFADEMVLDTTQKVKPTTSSIPDSKRITVLSDKKLDWSNMSFVGNKLKKSNPDFQVHFQSFITGGIQTDQIKEEENLNNEERATIVINRKNGNEGQTRQKSQAHHFFSSSSDEEIF